MVLLVCSIGTFAGVNLCLFKFFGEILTANDFWNMPVMAVSLLFVGAIGAVL